MDRPSAPQKNSLPKFSFFVKHLINITFVKNTPNVSRIMLTQIQPCINKIKIGFDFKLVYSVERHNSNSNKNSDSMRCLMFRYLLRKIHFGNLFIRKCISSDIILLEEHLTYRFKYVSDEIISNSIFFRQNKFRPNTILRV